MATRLNPHVRTLLDKFLAQFEEAILARLGPAATGKGNRGAARASGGGGRQCPVPGCSSASAGPRNRFFCRDHAHSLSKTAQNKILVAAKQDAPGARGASKVSATDGRRKRRGPRGPLDMQCRVEGCKNLSRGPRFGFICDDHRKTLGKKQQVEAREEYKAKHKAA